MPGDIDGAFCKIFRQAAGGTIGNPVGLPSEDGRRGKIKVSSEQREGSIGGEAEMEEKMTGENTAEEVIRKDDLTEQAAEAAGTEEAGAESEPVREATDAGAEAEKEETEAAAAAGAKEEAGEESQTLRYNITWKPVNCIQAEQQMNCVSPITLTGLIPGTDYEIMVMDADSETVATTVNIRVPAPQNCPRDKITFSTIFTLVA